MAKNSDAILFGAVGGPQWDSLGWDDRPEQALLGLRKSLGLFANLRPAFLFNELASASPLKNHIEAFEQTRRTQRPWLFDYSN